MSGAAHPTPDPESRRWIEQLREGHPRREQTIANLHRVLLRVAFHELGRRRGQLGPIAGPEFETASAGAQHGRHYATTGIAPDLMDATKAAVRAMIAHLVSARGLSREEAYILCSVAVDLKISEVVDAPNWVVTAFLPDALFA